MVGMVSRRALGIVSALIALLIATAATMGRPQAQEADTVSATSPAKASIPGATNKRAGSHRQKRGGPESIKGDDTNATPAEGQSDLIKVLQPAAGKKNPNK